MTGQPGPNGYPANTPTDFLADPQKLLQPLRPLTCDGTQVHDNCEARGSRSCQLWTWQLASRIIDGIVLLKKSLARPTTAYPELAVGTSDHDQMPTHPRHDTHAHDVQVATTKPTSDTLVYQASVYTHLSKLLSGECEACNKYKSFRQGE